MKINKKLNLNRNMLQALGKKRFQCAVSSTNIFTQLEYSRLYINGMCLCKSSCECAADAMDNRSE